jgi:membrane protease YdiL (CAAX protease family)
MSVASDPGNARSVAPVPRDRSADDGGPAGWLAGHPLVGFVAITYAISWTSWLVAWLIGDSVVAVIVFVAGAFGPAAAAAIVRVRSGEPLRPWLLAVVRWRVAPRFWAYALALPVALYAVANVVLAVAGRPVDPSLLAARAVPYLGTLLVVMVVGGGQEELGWRGFLLPRLEARHSPVRATLILGLVWGVWHVPIYGPMGFVVPLVLAFLYTWLFNRTGSILLVMVLHGGLTASQDHLVLLAEEIHGVTDVAIGIAYVVGVATLLLATRGRLGLPRGRSAPLAGAGAEGEPVATSPARARPSTERSP